MAVTTETARDLYYDHIQWKVLRAVDAEAAFPHLPERASFESIDFYVDGYRLRLTANQDTDEIVFVVEPAIEAPVTHSLAHPVLKNLVGREFGWAWYARNVQGYEDMLLLAFTGDVAEAGASPQLMFLVEASTIHIRKIMPAA